MAAEIKVPDLSLADYRKLTQKPLQRSVDMSAEMAQEALEVITMSVDKHTQGPNKNYEAAAQLIKISLDKKFGAAWHCVIGEGFGFDITYQSSNMAYIYYGTLGVLIFKG
jgi:dynein light chain 4, axonemal